MVQERNGFQLSSKLCWTFVLTNAQLAEFEFLKEQILVCLVESVIAYEFLYGLYSEIIDKINKFFSSNIYDADTIIINSDILFHETILLYL